MNKFVRFSDDEYTVMVLQGLKRMIRRSDYFVGYVPPRDVMRDNADSGEVTDALQHAIDVVRGNLVIKDKDLE